MSAGVVAAVGDCVEWAACVSAECAEEVVEGVLVYECELKPCVASYCTSRAGA